MTDIPFIQSIKLTNFLSYGSSSDETKLKPLNVLIGPNLSGKSNLIEALSILHSAPKDLAEPIREGGGIGEWIWKGGNNKNPITEIAVVLSNPIGTLSLRYGLSFTVVAQRLELTDEFLEDKDKRNIREDDVYFYYRYDKGKPTLNVRDINPSSASDGFKSIPRHLKREDLDLEQSVLSQRKDPDQYPELTYVGNQFSKICLFREWNSGRYTAPRLPQKPDLPQDFLSESGNNLALVLNSLEHKSDTKKILIDRLRQFNSNINDFTISIKGGTVQLFLHEKGLREPIPATRLSDGTLRYLCLLSILCHPTPPPVIGIEEPELSLHPDAIKIVAELLKEASQRTQLIVTTHSDSLVSDLSDSPDSVIVCEREQDGTVLKRLDPEVLKEWLKKYSLGMLWRMGELGGNPQ